MAFFCAMLDTCAVWSCLRLKAPASPQARRLLRAYVAAQRTLAPAGTEKTHETPNNKKKDRKKMRLLPQVRLVVCCACGHLRCVVMPPFPLRFVLFFDK